MAESNRRRRVNGLLGAGGGGLIGFGVAVVLHLAANPLFEGSTGWVRELHGLLWTVVPALTILGLAAGWWVTGRPRSQ